MTHDAQLWALLLRHRIREQAHAFTEPRSNERTATMTVALRSYVPADLG